MYCSYATHPNKHDIKIWFNKLLLARMKRAGIEIQPNGRRVVDRPKLLVVHERFTESHAMYRSFARIIRRLSDHFDLVALADDAMIDGASDAIFSEVIKLPGKRPPVAEIVKKILAISPDMIFYPSLGMSHWTVMLALLRLAPIQVASLGHPATTKSDAIDYIYTAAMDGDLHRKYFQSAFWWANGLVYTLNIQSWSKNCPLCKLLVIGKFESRLTRK